MNLRPSIVLLNKQNQPMVFFRGVKSVVENIDRKSIMKICKKVETILMNEDLSVFLGYKI